jgi:hypothetical protein
MIPSGKSGRTASAPGSSYRKANTAELSNTFGMGFRFRPLLLGFAAPILAQHLDSGMLTPPVLGYDPASLIQRLVSGLNFQPVLGDDDRNVCTGSDMVLFAPLYWKCDPPLIVDFTGD